jgi:hypothetical protein
MNRFTTRRALGDLSPVRRAAGFAVAALITGAGLTRSANAAAAPVLIDFGNDQSFRGATVHNPDQHGNYWNSMRTGVFYQNLVDTTNTPTTIDFGFSTPVGTDSYNGPAGPTAGQPLSQAEIDAADIDETALGILGVKAAAVDYVAEFECRFEIQQLDPAKKYNLTFYGSHKFSNNDSTVYTVFTDNTYTTEVASGSLLVQNHDMPWLHNRDTVRTLSNIAPQTSNILYVQFTGDQGSFGYLNSMMISEAVATSIWNVDDGGSWFTPTNWAGSVPNGVGAEADFLGKITATHSVNADSPVTVGTMRFNNANSYVIGGASTLTLEAASGSALVDVQLGTHRINVPLTVASDTNLQVAAGTTLRISDPVTINANKHVTQSGAGNVLYESTVNVLSGGSIQFGNSSHLAGLTLAAGASAQVTQGGGKVMTIDSVNLGASGTLDLKDNKLITSTSPGHGTNFIYDGLQGAVQRAYNSQSWDQPGLTTSMPAAKTGLTTIGITTGAARGGLGPTDTDLFGGQTYTGASTLAMYTYAGDANLDGLIDGGDYGIIDNNVTIPGAEGYFNGDFNYDGVIDGGDYGIIDNNITAQGAPFPVSGLVGLSGVTAIPEPCACGFAILTAAGLFSRRSRRPGKSKL